MPKGKPRPKVAKTVEPIITTAGEAPTGPALAKLLYEDYRAVSDATDGYLSEAEANALWQVATAAYKNTGNYWIEDGSYKGKSTVMIAGALALMAIGDTTEHVLISVDPHEGKLSFPSHYAVDKLLDSDHLSEELPTFDAFHATIDSAGLGDVVVAMMGRFTDYTPKKPVGLIFIDALHDYDSVKADWEHAKQFLAEGATVMFHDYGKWHGPTQVVDEAVQAGELEVVVQDETLVVCKFLGVK